MIKFADIQISKLSDNWQFGITSVLNMYRKVANSSLSWLVARFQIIRMLVKGKFDAYVL